MFFFYSDFLFVENNNKDNSPKTLNDKIHQASSQKFRQFLYCLPFKKKIQIPISLCFYWSSRLGLQNTQITSLQRGKTLLISPNESPGYDTMQSNIETPVM